MPSDQEHLYFKKYEDRVPPAPIPDSLPRTAVFQILSLVFVFIGIAYLNWRWFHSLNEDALWFAVPLVAAETLSFVGSLLTIINYWANRDPRPQKPVHLLSDIKDLQKNESDRPIGIDVFIATYNEDAALVELTIKDAKAMTYPFEDVAVNVYVLDDGGRDGRDPEKENFKQLAENYGVGYFVRENNEGYKAGNLNNAMYQTSGDIVVILDADTRPFPQFLEHTTGYFRNFRMAWVQTPQWFYDLVEAKPLSVYLKESFGRLGYHTGRFIEKMFGPVKTGDDIFGNSPQMFYDVILRRRNNYNAAFCCGAGSLHRREALETMAEKNHQYEVKKALKKRTAGVKVMSQDKYRQLKEEIRKDIAKKPFMYHASEDIYTSIILHADKHRWKSVQHPVVECKMLSPQDLDGWIKQRTRYATGSLDIGINQRNPLFMKGLSFWQRIAYFTTIYSYFAPLWLIIFLLSPIVFFFTLTPPVQAFNFDFFIRFIPFQVLNALVMAVGSWGISTIRSEQYYVASFWLYLKSLIAVLRKKKVKFNVTSKQIQLNNNIGHTVPHLLIVVLTVAGLAYNGYLITENIHPSFSAFAANTIWGVYNIYLLSAYIRAGFWKTNE